MCITLYHLMLPIPSELNNIISTGDWGSERLWSKRLERRGLNLKAMLLSRQYFFHNHISTEPTIQQFNYEYPWLRRKFSLLLFASLKYISLNIIFNCDMITQLPGLYPCCKSIVHYVSVSYIANGQNYDFIVLAP
jgi:hypothetical protein